MAYHDITAHFNRLGAAPPPESASGLGVFSPGDGAEITRLSIDTPESLERKLAAARAAQKSWAARPYEERKALLERFAAALNAQRDTLAALITLEAGKLAAEAQGEAQSAGDTLLKTIKDAGLAEFNGMLRQKERPPVGVVGLITSFNFPLAVASWTLAPALLAGNAVLWKPSEKTPLTALACKAIFDQVAGGWADLLAILVGERAIGQALVAHDWVDMVSATGSVAMGQGIKAALATKANQGVPPILELGGNNGIIISNRLTPEQLAWSVSALLTSFFGTAGQRCTNTRRLIVHREVQAQAVALLEGHIKGLLDAGVIGNPLAGAANAYGYGPLIDEDAYRRFEQAKQRVVAEGGRLLFGERLLAEEYPEAYYVAPVLALLPEQAALMHEEVFAPLLFIVPYEGDIGNAIALLNAPSNAGLVSGIYTQSRLEAERFAQETEAGHGVINSPKGTGTPAYGMGFGGNKASGEGEILNAADPLQAFTRRDAFRRIAWNKEVGFLFEE